MGCKSSKDVTAPSSKKPVKDTNGPTGRHHRPVVSSLQAIKEIPPAELEKYKPSDIISFVKSGNLPMINGLIKYYNL
jgi:hypothetical protein